MIASFKPRDVIVLSASRVSPEWVFTKIDRTVSISLMSSVEKSYNNAAKRTIALECPFPYVFPEAALTALVKTASKMALAGTPEILGQWFVFCAARLPGPFQVRVQKAQSSLLPTTLGD